MLIQPHAGADWPDAVEGYGFALAAKLMYRETPYIQRVVREIWETEPVILDGDGQRMLLASMDARAFIVFGGETDYQKWYDLADGDNIDRAYGSVHRAVFAVLEPFLGAALDFCASHTHVALRIAGHGLGGALAALTALEAGHGFAGQVITFGMPRIIANGRIDPEVKAHLNPRITRIVNQDDLVARLPPGYEHIGRPVWFDAYGIPGDIDRAPPSVVGPLSERAFGRLRDEVRRLVEARESSGPDAALQASTLKTTLQGLFPGIRSHEIDSYLTALRRAGGRTVEDFRKEKSNARRTYEAAADIESFAIKQYADEQRELSTTEISAQPKSAAAMQIPVLLRLTTPDWDAPAGLRVQSRIGTIVTALATTEQLDRLRDDDAVQNISISRSAGTLELNDTLSFISADDGQLTLADDTPITERGDAAIFGLIDSGIDILHDAFKDADGHSRIIGVWHQAGTQGQTPHELHPEFTQDYGTLYTGAQIDALVQDPAFAATMTPPILRDPAFDPAEPGHGTHVASIGAGCAFGTVGRGMAPDAKILVVIPNMRTTPGDPPSIGYSMSHVDALAFMRKVAAGDNPLLGSSLPIAINVSLGMNAGAHDGKSTLEAAFDAMTGIGREPGCVIVKSAGNERSHDIHARIRPNADAWQRVDWESSATPRVRDYFEAWFDARDDLEFQLSCPPHVRANNQDPVPPVQIDPANPVATVDMGGNRVSLRLTRFHFDNGDHLLAIDILKADRPIHAGVWTLSVRAQQIASVNGALDVWAERVGRRPVRFLAPDQQRTLSIPGTAETVITVSACDLNGVLNPSSSYGLTRTDEAKPDVCAPGHNVIGARSNGKPFEWVHLTGTSMAAPHVTGLIVLALSRRHKSGKPQFNANQIRQMLNRTTRTFPSPHNHGLGYGIVHAQNFLRLT